MSSKITLKPLDDGQRPVEIPVGKTTIGRGPFLGCSDKKVSRNHAVLEVTAKGEVFLTPTHVNPCFYQPTAESPGQILKKDIPHKLENGDTFSLLPRAFRYQLIVQGDKDQEKIDQKELSKAKTNGSTGKCDAILNERNKDPKKGISNEELNDGNTVTEKPFSKDDHILSDTNKNCSKEENSLAKKSAPEDDDEDEEEEEEEEEEEDSKSPSAKTSNEDFEKEKPETNSISEKEDKLESDKESGDKKDSKDDSHDNDESCAEDKTECDKPKFSEKIVEENESTLGNDTFAKDKTDSVQSSEKVESKEKSDDKKTEVSASNGDENLDSETKDFENEDDKSREIPEWVPSDDPPPSKRGRKRGSPKKQTTEKKPVKRKQVTKVEPEDSAVKKRGRKKVQKFSFDDGEGTSQKNTTPGRTSSRTNRQTRQGLSLEDFIVSDDDEWQSDRDLPKRRRRRGSGKRKGGDESGSDWEIDHKKTKKPAHKYGSGSESGSDWGSPKKKKAGPGRGRGRRKAKPDISDAGSDEDLEPPSSEPDKKSRISCTYGKKCFRRNQNHLEQFSHPGDSDYEGAEEADAPTPVPAPAAAASEKNDGISDSEDESGKKECPFGENCFRKNPQHKRDFKHTKNRKVRPKREAAKPGKRGRGSKISEDIDSYELNDSLLTEGSDEYKPADSGSDFESSEKIKKSAAKGKGAKTKRGRKV